jgi:hypothetical protein
MTAPPYGPLLAVGLDEMPRLLAFPGHSLASTQLQKML